MKTFKNTFEIIDYVRLFHVRMCEFYEKLKILTDNQRLKMLLEYLISREQKNEETLLTYKKEASVNVLNSWFQYIPENIPDNCLKEIDLSVELTTDDVVDYVLRLNNCLIEMYKGLINETDVEDVKDVFVSLLKGIEKEEKNLVRDAALLNDI